MSSKVPPIFFGLLSLALAALAAVFLHGAIAGNPGVGSLPVFALSIMFAAFSVGFGKFAYEDYREWRFAS